MADNTSNNIVNFIVNDLATNKLNKIANSFEQAKSKIDKTIVGPTGRTSAAQDVALSIAPIMRSQSQRELISNLYSTPSNIITKGTSSKYTGSLYKPTGYVSKGSLAKNVIEAQLTQEFAIEFSKNLDIIAGEQFVQDFQSKFEVEVAKSLRRSLGASKAAATRNKNKAFKAAATAAISKDYSNFEIINLTDKDLGGKGAISSEVAEKIEKINTKFKLGLINAKQYNNALYNLTETTEGFKKETILGEISLGKLILRAGATIPIWFALRQAFMSVIQTVQEIVKTYAELDAGMAKVMAVATYTTQNQKKVYADLEYAARQYWVTSTASYKDITQSMYELGSAGRSTEEMLVGFKHIMDLSIASYTDVTTAARSVAGILNVFDKELSTVGNTEQKIAYVTDALAQSWKEHQIEVEDITQAFQYLGPAAAATGVTFKEFLAAVGNMSDVMLRGGKGGRLLASAIGELAAKQDKLKDLGIQFDPYKPLKFREVMIQLKDIYDKQGKSLSTNQTFLDIFGREGSRAILDIIQNWERWNLEIERTPAAIDRTATKLKELAQSTWAAKIQRLWRNIITGTDIGTGETKKGILDASILAFENPREQNLAVKELVNSYKNGFRLIKEDYVNLMKSLLASKSYNIANELQVAVENADPSFKKLRENIYDTGMLLERNPKTIDTILGKYNEWSKVTAKIKKDVSNTTNNTPIFNPQQLKEFKDIKDSIIETQIKAFNRPDSAPDLIIAGRNLVKYAEEYSKYRKGSVSTEQVLNSLLSKDETTLANMGMSVDDIKTGFNKVVDVEKEAYAELRKLTEEANNLSNTLKASLTEGFEGLLSGEKNIKDFFSGLSTTIQSSFRKEIAEGISERIVNSGMGDVFGQMGVDLKNLFSGRNHTFSDEIKSSIKSGAESLGIKVNSAFDYGSDLTYKRIVKGFEDGGNNGGNTTGSSSILSGNNLGSLSSLFSGFSSANNNGIASSIAQGTLMNGSTGGIFNAFSALTNNSTSGSSQKSSGGNWFTNLASNIFGSGGSSSNLLGVGKGGSTKGALAGGSFMGNAGKVAGAGMSVASFGTDLANAYKAKGSGNPWGSAMNLGMSGAMAGMMVGGPIGALIGGAIGVTMGAIQGSKSKTTDEWNNYTAQVTSRIDVTNKTLAVVNRNLVALKSTLQTFMLPTSSYFREKTSIESEYAIAANRGII